MIASASEEQAQVAREVDRNLVNIRDLSMQSSAGGQPDQCGQSGVVAPGGGLEYIGGAFLDLILARSSGKKATLGGGLFAANKRLDLLTSPALEYQCCVGATEAEAVAHHGIELGVLNGAALNRQVTISGSTSSTLTEPAMKIAFHHQHAVDRFLHAGGAQR